MGVDLSSLTSYSIAQHSVTDEMSLSRSHLSFSNGKSTEKGIEFRVNSSICLTCSEYSLLSNSTIFATGLVMGLEVVYQVFLI